MRRVVRLAGLVIAGFFCVQSVSAQQSAGAECADPSRSLLWTVEGENSTVHLFGSLHLGEADFYPLHPTIESTFRDADHFVFEVDPASAADPQMMATIQAQGMLGPNEQLADYLSPAVIEDLKTVLQNMGLPAQNFMRFRPWMLAMVLTQLQYSQLGYMPQHGVEFYLYGKKPADADVVELESLEEQIEFLQQLDSEAHLAYLLETLESAKEDMQDLVHAWECADKAALEALLIEAFEDAEAPPDVDLQALKEAMLDDRNAAMADSIEGFLENGSGEYFVIVGAAHYVGDESIVDILRERGHTVERVEL